MDPLKLLTTATGLRVKEIRASHSPSQESKPTGTTIAAITTTSQTGKRKREEPEFISVDESRTILKRNKIKVTDLGALRKAKEGGKNVQKDHYRLFPTPVTSFQQLPARFSVHPGLARNLAQHGYAEPTEVQMAALPLLLGAEPLPDLLTVAPTGSGKTLAFMVPVIHKIAQRRHRKPSPHTENYASALILAPTKELVTQIVNEGRKLTVGTGVSISAVRKGMRISGCIRINQVGSERNIIEEPSSKLANSDPVEVKSDILVSTPLGLLHAIASDEDAQMGSLPHVQHLILDEADVLLDELFRKQSLGAWKACTSQELQVSLWSATMGSNIEEMALTTVTEHRETITQSQRQLLRCVVGLKDSAVSTVTHRLVFAGTEHGKLLGLRNILRPPPSLTGEEQQPLRFPFLVYAQTIERATALHNELLHDFPSEAGGTERVAVLHSDLSDTKRANVMARFRAGDIWILFTTDLLSRGMDFRGVNGIVNYDIPTTAAAYVHRAGRSGRAGRAGGIAVTLFTQEDFKYLRGIVNVIAASEKAKGSSWENAEGLQKWMFDALPNISKKDKKELKQRGVHSRRAIKESDDQKAIKEKRKARIGTQSGYQIQKEKNRKGAIAASKRKKRQEEDDSDGSGWGGF
jgi:ATP-dependent RNA helicase DDX52/ROK1